ncbi:MAG: FtsQ-type POTRA domain-containing protein [Miniphocaeibacter sp.]|uniref:cell division protein FtsQ/DivIB n=1 Tax=Miniphocaeibacter sp. TaxID=3100973 RepID=UPI001793B36D|nr:FtsQ-type POTRA domain-containing protein [Gallicola sp.]
MRQVGKKKYKKTKKNKNSVFVVILLTFLGIILTLSFFALTHDYFNIKTVSIQGNKYLDEKDIVEKSNLLGKNIFRTSEKQIKKSILDDNILKIEVSKEYPNKINIKIVENGIIAYIKNEDGSYNSLDALGKVSKKKIEDINDIPEINGVDASLLKNESSIFDDKNIKIIFDYTNKSKIDVNRYDFSNINDIVLYDKDSTKYIIGNTADLEDKMILLDQLVNQISTDDISVKIIDVSNIDKPLIKAD